MTLLSPCDSYGNLKRMNIENKVLCMEAHLVINYCSKIKTTAHMHAQAKGKMVHPNPYPTSGCDEYIIYT